MSIRIATRKTLKSCKKVKIHPNAYKAFEFVQSLTFSFRGAIKQDLVNKDLLTVALVLRAKIVTHELQIYSGFESILFDINSIEPTECIVILDDDICDSEIEQQAWVGVFTNCFLSSISSKNLNILHTTINDKVNSQIAQQIFNRPRLSQNLLAQMTEKSKSAIAKQKSRQNKSPQEGPRSIFEQVRKAIGDQ
jgi:50S ribosomal subunit-associated GTPase HflX